MADGQSLSLRDQLSAVRDEIVARDETPAAGGETATEAPAPAPGEAAAAETATPEPGKTTDAAPSSQDRDEHGRFKPKTDAPAPDGATTQPPAATESAATAAPEPQTETTRVPHSLPAAVKAKFATLDPDVRSAFVALEDSVQTAKAEWGPKGQRLNRFDEIIGPHVDRWRVAGLDEYSGVQSLIAAQSMLDRDPVSGILQIARSYNLTPAHLAQAFGLSQTTAAGPGTEGQPAPTATPDLQGALQSALTPVLQQVQTLQQQWQQDRQGQEAARIADAQRAIDAFAADPANMYFGNVESALADIFARMPPDGRPHAERLKDAYERAIWADPTIRPLLQKAQADASASEAARQAAEAKAAADKAARDKAQAANRAAGSVTGSPSGGAGPTGGGPARSLREELEAARQQVSGQL